MTITGPQPAGPEFAAVFREDFAAASAVAAEHAAGTPLSDLAAAAPEEDGAAKLERLEAHLVLVDGREFRVRIVNRDFVAWDLTRAKRKWPMAEDAPFLLNTFLTFAALRREGSWTGSEFAAFEESVDYLQLSRGEAARPTRAGVGPA